VRNYEKDKRFLIPLYGTFIWDMCTYVYMLRMVYTDHITGSVWNYLLYAYAFAHSGAINAIVGHELIHRR
jgi:hypothetical protein